MPVQSLQSDLWLGSVGTRSIRLTHSTAQASLAHAQRIAADLGTGDAESSLAAYWSLADRLQQWRQIIDRVGRKQAGQSCFVEVGSGMGLFVLVGAALGLRVLGIEASSDRYQQSLRIAHDLFRDNLMCPPFINAYSEALPLPNASADVVASFQTLEHVRDVEQTLREIRRVLKPGGLFFAQVPNYASFYESHYGVLAPLSMGKAWLRRYLRFRGRPTAFLDHLQWVSPPTLRTQLQGAGFSSARIGAISRPSYSNAALSAIPGSPPFRFRRGIVASRFARGLALVCDRLRINSHCYPQIEIWAEA